VEVEASRARPGVPPVRIADFRSKGFVKWRYGLVRRRSSGITLPSLCREWHETIPTGRVNQLQLVILIDRIGAPDAADHGHCGRRAREELFKT